MGELTPFSHFFMIYFCVGFLSLPGAGGAFTAGVYISRYQVTKVILIIRIFHLDFLTIRKFCQISANKDFLANSLSMNKFWQRS